MNHLCPAVGAAGAYRARAWLGGASRGRRAGGASWRRGGRARAAAAAPAAPPPASAPAPGPPTGRPGCGLLPGA